MAVWHLRDIRLALESRGWVILRERPGDGYGIPGTWEIQRSTRIPPLLIDFEGLDDMVCLPVDQSYGCGIRNHGPGLYFRKQKSRNLWRDEVEQLVSRLDSLESELVSKVESAIPEE